MKAILIELLESLSQNEMKKIEYFIQNKYFNTDKTVIVLYNYFKNNIQQTIKQEEFSDATKLEMCRYISPKKSTIGSSLNKKQSAYLAAKMTLLTDAVRKFLTIEALEEDEALQSNLLHRKLMDKKQFRALEKNLIKQKKALQKPQAKGADYYFYESQLEMDTLDFLYLQGSIRKQDNLSELTLSFDTYYLIKRLDYHLTAISLMNISNRKTYDFGRFNVISGLIRLPQYAQHPLIRSYQLAIDMIQTDDQSAYGNLLLLLEQEAKEIPKNNLIDFYKMATAFCARRIREGEEAYHQHCFNIYKTMESNDLVKEGNFIPISKLKNIIGTSCHVGEFEWAIQILEKHKSIIPQILREQVYHYNMGVIAFYQKNYKQAISHFIRVDKVNVNYDINCRVLILKSYYELDYDYDERTMQQFRSTKRFIHDNKSLKINDKQGWENFVSAAANLYKVRHQYGKTTVERVQQQIDNFKSINDKRWLLEKIEDLERQIK